MAGKYLKARKLAKEIEKKAKKTAEKKQNAKEGLEKAEEILDISKELGVDVTEVDEIIEQARENFEDKEFEKASELINEGLDVLGDANEDRVKEIVEKIESFYEYLEVDLEETDTGGLVNEAESLLKDDKYREAINIADQALDNAKNEVYENFKDRLYSIESKKDILDNLDGDPSKFNEDFKSAEEYLEEDNFEDSKEILDKVEREIDDDIRSKVNDKTQEIEKIGELIRKNGISTEGVEETVSDIRAKSKNGEFNEVIDLFGKTERELRDKKDELVSKMVKKLRNGIEEARDLGAPEDKIKEINEKIDDLQEKEDFGKILDLLDELFEKLEEAKFHRVLKTIAESRENFIKAKKIGVDISEPMDILNKARNALKQGDHREALEYAKEGRKKVRDIVKKHEQTQNAIEKAMELKEGLIDFGIDLADVEEHIEEAKEHMENKEYSKSKDVIKEVEKEIDKKAYEKIMEFIEEFEVAILTLERMGIESDEYTEMLEEAIANTKTMDYIKAANIALDGKDEVTDKVNEELEQKIQNVSEIVKNIKDVMETEDIKEDLDNVKDLIDEAVQERDKEKYKSAYDRISEAEESVKEWQVGEADQKYREAADILDLLEETEFKDINVEDYKDSLEKAHKYIENKNYTEGIKETENILNDLNDKLKERSEDFFSKAKVEVVKAKKSGVDINRMRENLIDCKKHIKKERYTEAIRLSLEVERQASRARKERVETQKLISELNKDIKRVRRNLPAEDIKPANDLLKEAKRGFQERNYTEAKELAHKTSDKIEELRKKKEFEEYYGIYNELIKRAGAISVDTEDIQDQVNKVVNMAEEGDYNSAIQNIKQKNEEVIEEIKSSVEPRLAHTKEIIESAKEIGIDISSQDDLLEKAKEDFENDEFESAVEKIIECQNQIQEIRDKSKRAARNVKRAKDRLEDARDLHADVSTANNELQDAMDAIKNDEYGQAIDKAEKAMSSIRLAEKNRVENILDTFKDKINDIRMEGVNTSLADNLIARAEKAKKNENYKEAINLAMQSEGELERIELQQNLAKRSISTTRDKLNKAKKEGINVKKPEKMLKEAKKSYEGGFYVKAFDKAVNCGDVLNNKIRAFKESKNILDKIEKIVEGIKDLGIEEKELEEKCSKAVDSFENDNYEKSYSLANRAKEELSNLKRNLPDYISDLEKTINEISSKEKNIGEAEKYIGKARANLKMGNTLDVVEFLNKAKEEYGGKYFEEYEKYMEETTELVKKAKKFGTDVHEAQEVIEKARKMRDEDVEKASKKAKQALNKIEEILAPYSPNIEIQIDGKLRLKRWNNLDISIKNSGGGVAKSPSLEIEGAQTKDIDLPSMLKANESFDTKVRMKPVEDKVIFKGVGTRIFDNKDMVCEIQVDVIESDFKIIKATGEEKCSVCKGDIKEGLDVIVCDCGTTYHKLCGERKGECPECGLEFTFDEEKKEEKEGKKASKRVALRI